MQATAGAQQRFSHNPDDNFFKSHREQKTKVTKEMPRESKTQWNSYWGISTASFIRLNCKNGHKTKEDDPNIISAALLR
jgi:hypothetical protein